MSGTAGQPEEFACPGCGQGFHATPDELAQVAQCPACQTQFVIPAIDGSTELPPDYEAPLAERPFADSAGTELDSLRMRQVITARRAAIRSRSYTLLGAMLCAVACAKLVALMIPHIRHGEWSRPLVAYGLGAALSVVGAVYSLQRAAALNKESKASAIPEPETPPDFSTLSDGSQQAKNLENIT